MEDDDETGGGRAREVFHDGERAVQERVGVRERIDQVGAAMIHDSMSLQHRQFFAQQQLLFAGSLDARNRPWASVLAGERGFVHAIDKHTLRIDALPAAGDPLAGNLARGAALGLLGIEFATRRRNRMNGSVVAVDESGFTVAVEQSFGNCPQYIQARDQRWRERSEAAPAAEQLDARLSEDALALAGRADTLMIASASPHARAGGGADGVDVSHRGGRAGFVRATRNAEGAVVLTMPDFRGNYMFNTLGNLTAYPFAGLLLPDFESGDLLQVTGSASIVWDETEAAAYPGAQRLVRVVADEARLHRGALALEWSEPEFARQLDDTGPWT